jgi:uncharacterized protein (TIGR02246 family)
MRMLSCILGSSLCALAVTLPAQAETAKPDPARAFIEKQAVAFGEAFTRGDFKSVGEMYAEDAIVFPPDADMVQGRAAIQAFWKSVYDSGAKGASLSVVDVQSSGDVAAEVGRAYLTVTAPNQPEVRQHVKYVVVWKRQNDGSWKLYRDIWNAAPAPANK